MNILLITANTIITLAALALAVSQIQRYLLSNIWRSLLTGVMFGIAAALNLLQPYEVSPGVLIDGRNVFVTFAPAVAGLPGGLLALAIGAATRVYIGGIGMPSGVISMGFCFLIGLIWYYSKLSGRVENTSRWLILGFGICLSIFAILLIPAPIGWQAFAMSGPYLAVLYLCASLVLGWFLDRETRFNSAGQEFQLMSELDPLTGALNRRGFRERFDKITAAKRTQLPSLEAKAVGFCFFVIDVDFLKSLNDTYGHTFGDEALKKVTNSIAGTIRPNDLVARFGGDEFVVCLFDIPQKRAADLAESLFDGLSSLNLSHGDETVKVSVSIGGVFAGYKSTSVADLMASADVQVYQAKSAGRGSYSFQIH